MSRVRTFGRDFTIIYALCEADFRLRYVGKTVNRLEDRLQDHVRTARRGSKYPVHNWIRRRIEDKEIFLIKSLEKVSNSENWEERERFWIERLRKEGCDLLNATIGGEGTSGFVRSDEWKTLMSARFRIGDECICEICGKSRWLKPSAIKKNRGKTCSRKCAAALKRQRLFNRSHCKHGHLMTSENTRISGTGAPKCIECARISCRGKKSP